ncbi:MAG: GNAT family N-acetyltransferase [Candidatus Zixiibacteriota bacterium]|nr:MAG: GNAT family N-acetyltransferase [candidate division Zixibacteria bacterium]
MKKEKLPHIPLTFRPLTKSRWNDFERLFGPRGACGGCWCMHWRTRHAEFERLKGDGNKRAMKKLVDSGRVPGILAYLKNEPVGWCSIGPRKEFVRFEKSRIFKPVDDREVWSLNCLFVAKEHRRSGVSRQLIEAAVAHAAGKGARIVEAYPFEPKKGNQPDPFVWTGLASSYFEAGFKEIARRSPTRPIVWREIK